jgi:hypothetical protein
MRNLLCCIDLANDLGRPLSIISNPSLVLALRMSTSATNNGKVRLLRLSTEALLDSYSIGYHRFKLTYKTCTKNMMVERKAQVQRSFLTC